MATYIQGLTDYIPQVQPFTPDYNFYNQALAFKQGKYDAARTKLNNVYGSLLNAPLTRDDNSETRDKFFKTIEQDIHKMAGSDLSLVQNVEAAEGVFNQLTDNKQVVKDMVWTKNFQRQQQKSSNLKNCVDPEKCGGQWWEGGDKLMQYDYMNFKNATAEQAMNIGNTSYTSYQDITKKAMALAKEADFNVSIDEVTGSWITTTKNGPEVIGDLSDLLQGSLSQDPKIKAYYNGVAKLRRQNYMYGNKDKYGSLEAAEQAYISEQSQIIEKAYGPQTTKLEDNIAVNEAKSKALTKEHAKAMPDVQNRVAQAINNFTKQNEALNASLEDAKEVNGTINNAKQRQKYSGVDIDRINSALGLRQDIGKIAGTLAFKDYTVSKKVNPYGIESVRQKNRMLLEEQRYQHSDELTRLTIAGRNQAAAIKAGAGTNGVKGSPSANVPSVVSNLPGLSTAKTDTPNAGYNAYDAAHNKIESDISGNERLMLGEVFKLTRNAAESGTEASVKAKEDYVDLVTKINTGAGNSLMMANIKNAVGLNAKYQIAKEFQFKADDYKGSHIDNIYQEAEKMFDPNVEDNDIMRTYMAPIWRNKQHAIQGIRSKNIALGSMDKYMGEESERIAKEVRIDATWDAKWGDAFSVYLDDAGAPVDENTFVRGMIKKGYDPEVAALMYNSDDTDDDNPSVGKMWRKAFSTKAEPKGQYAYAALTGIGGSATRAHNYMNIDPLANQSIGSMGYVGIMKDGLNSDNALFARGGFGENLPEETDPKVKELMALIYKDYISAGSKDKKRAILEMTYSDIAGGNADYMGVNIKLNEAYRKKYAGTANNLGLMSDIKLVTEGLFMAMPRTETDNLITEGSKLSAVEGAMAWSGEMPINLYPGYTEDMMLYKRDGQYIATGKVQIGVNEDGTKQMYPYEAPIVNAGSADEALMAIEANIADYVNIARAQEIEWQSKQK